MLMNFGYNMNMFGNCGMSSLFSGGLSSLGSSGIGNIFSGNFGMNSLFTNCFGDVDYDAVAGYGIANIFMGAATTAIGSAIRNKRAAKAEHEDNKSRIADINKEIETKTSDKAELNSENERLKGEADTAKSKSETYATQISAKETEITNLQANYDALTAAAATDETKKAAQTEALNELNTAKEELEKLKEQKAEQDKIVEDNNKKIEANKTEIDKLDDEIKTLQAEKAKLQETVGDVVLDKAEGLKIGRTTKKDFDKKWNTDGSAKNTEFTKGDMRYAIAGFRNAATEEDKKAWANKIATIYKNMSQTDITEDFKNARKYVDKYVG